MEQLTLIIMERLIKEFPELRWVDIQKEQMREERPPIVFPAALVSVTIPSCTDLNDVNQQCHALVEIQLCWSWTQETSASAFSKEDRAASFEYLKTNRKVYEKFQGWTLEGTPYSPLSRIKGGGDPLLRKGYKITETLFKTEYFDQSFEPLYLGDFLGNLIQDNQGNTIQLNEI